MKVNIYETVEVTDDARKRLKTHLGQKQTVSRDQLKEFIWEHGRNWESFIGAPEPQKAAPDVDEDLLGTPDPGAYDRHLRLVNGEGTPEDIAAEIGEDLIGGDDDDDLIGGDDLEGLL